jgi:hypothetical protein
MGLLAHSKHEVRLEAACQQLLPVGLLGEAMLTEAGKAL